MDTDLCIVGGGFTGLWAALHAKDRDPARDVVVLEAETCGYGASGRNGGFLLASLTHGHRERAARASPTRSTRSSGSASRTTTACARDLERHGIDCDFEETGDLTVALEPHELEDLREEAAKLRELGHDVALLDREQVRAEVRSPTYLGGLWDRTGAALVHPGKLVRGLRDAARRAGVRVFERTPVVGIDPAGAGVEVATPAGEVVRARRALLATSAYRPLVRSVRRYVLPVYDYALMTEPLDAAQRESIGWPQPPGPRRRGQPVPLLPAERATTASSGAATTPSTASAGRWATTSTTTTRPSRSSPSTSSRRSRSSRACASRTAGAARSTPAAASRCSSARRSSGRVAYATGYTGLGVVRQPLRRRGRARPGRRPRDRGHAPPLRAPPPGAVPARAAPLGRGPAHPEPARRRRPPRGPARPLAPRARPRRARLRQLIRRARRAPAARSPRPAAGRSRRDPSRPRRR